MELGTIAHAAGDLEAKAVADSVEAELARNLQPPSASKKTANEHEALEIELEHESSEREAGETEKPPKNVPLEKEEVAASAIAVQSFVDSVYASEDRKTLTFTCFGTQSSSSNRKTTE